MNFGRKTELRIAAVGDIGLIGKIAQDIQERGPEFPFACVKSAFDNADFVFGNLEIPFSEQSMPPRFREIPPKLRANPEGVSALQHAGFDIVSLANNHVMDFGHGGLQVTMKLLDEKGIRYVGASRDLEHARQPVILRKSGLRIGFLAYAQQGEHSAGLNSAGGAPIQKKLIAEDLKSLVTSVDWVIVSIHFGMIYTDYPKREDQILARWIIDLGASVVLGHHPHVIQGIEEYHNGVIVYSLGEFIFDPTMGNVFANIATELRKQTLIAEILLGNDGVKINPIPVIIGEDYRPKLCKGEGKELILKRLDCISKPLRKYEIDFNKHVASRTVIHNIKVLRFNFVRLNWRYVFQRIKRIRFYHIKIILFYLKNLRLDKL